MALFLGAGPAGQLNLDPRDLRTHGVVVGMTGSGKTGLSLVILEELARAGVPIIAIDPKGDLGNLALVFPELRPRDFGPWTADAEAVARRFTTGLAASGLGEVELRALHRAVAGLRIYTPGSTAGEPVDVLASLRAPSCDPETLRALVADTVSAVLGLIGREPDPVRDPAHVLLSHILEAAWAQGEDLDLETLVLRLVDPPFARIGVFPTDRFLVPDERMKLALALNAVLASPSFATWRVGSSLDAESLCSGGVHIFNLAHLADPERHFFVALLLARLQAWSRAQPGTEDLRALLFFDECTSYVPPDPRRPPSKAPLLALMKQARAVGLGVLLATQNPVDLDYRALSNSGLWFVGRLRTEQDRGRLLKGLDPQLDAAVQGLATREFALVRAKGGHSVFKSRHTLCFLKGPMTRADLQSLTPASPTVPEPAKQVASDPSLPTEPPPVRTPQWVLDPRVAFSARMEGFFATNAAATETVELAPALLCELEIHFHADRDGFSDKVHEWRVAYPAGPTLKAVALGAEDLLDRLPGAVYRGLPEWMDQDEELSALRKAIADEVYRSESRGQFVNAGVKLYGRPGEARAAFDARVEQAIQLRVDDGVATLKERYEKAVDRIEDRLRAKQRQRQGFEGQLQRRRAEEAVNAGEMVLSLFTGRKKSLGTAMTKRSRTSDAADRIDRVAAEIEDLREDALGLRRALEDDIAAIQEREARLHEQTEEREVRLRRADVVVARFGILWVPASRRL